MPTPPPADVIEPHDTSTDEIETRAEFDRRLAEGSLAGLTVQGLRLDLDPVLESVTTYLRDANGLAGHHMVFAGLPTVAPCAKVGRADA